MPIIPVFDPDTGASGGPITGGGGGGGAPAWATVADLDFTGLDSQAMAGSTATVFNLAKGGAPFADVTASTNATSYDFSAGTSGIVYNTMGGLGTATIAIDLTDALSKAGAGPLGWDDWNEPVAIQLLVKNVTWGANIQDVIAGFGEQLNNPAVNTLSFAWRGTTDTVDADWKVRRYSGSSSENQVITNQTYSTSYLLTIIVHAGLITEQWVQPGATAVADDPRQGTGPYSAGYSSIASGAMPVALQKFMPFFGVIRGGAGTDWAGTLTHLRVQRFEVAP